MFGLVLGLGSMHSLWCVGATSPPGSPLHRHSTGPCFCPGFWGTSSCVTMAPRCHCWTRSLPIVQDCTAAVTARGESTQQLMCPGLGCLKGPALSHCCHWQEPKELRLIRAESDPLKPGVIPGHVQCLIDSEALADGKPQAGVCE